MNRKSILIADDNRALRKVLASTLAEQYEVTEVGDGRAMEEELNRRPFDLVVSDLNLPYTRGSIVLRKTSKFTVGPWNVEGLGIPTLVVTGMDPEEEEVKSVRRMVNVKAVLHKPVDIETFRTKVDEILNGGWELDTSSLNPAQAPADPLHTILVVDDELDIRDLISLIFEGIGIQACCCATVEAALRRCRTTKFDLILLDYVLENDIADTFLEELPNILGPDQMPPVILVSGYAEGLSIEKYTGFAQVKGIIGKPFDIKRMQEMAKSLVA